MESITVVLIDDLKDILELQKLAFSPVAEIVNNPNIQPMIQTYNELLEEFKNGLILKYTVDNKIIGSVRAYVDEQNICHIGKLVTHLEYQNKGVGKALMLEIEQHFKQCLKYTLFTGEATPNTLYLYSKLGYKEVTRDCNDICMIIMEKENRK